MRFGPDCLRLHELAADQRQEYLDANESYFLLPISSPEASEFLPLPERSDFRERHSCGLQEAASVSTQAFLAIIILLSMISMHTQHNKLMYENIPALLLSNLLYMSTSG